MKYLIILSVLFSVTANAGYWNPSLAEANKIAFEVLENKNPGYFRELVKKKNLNPDMLFDFNFRDNGVFDASIPQNALYRMGESGDEFYKVLVIELYEKMNANPNFVYMMPGRGESTPLSSARTKWSIDYLVKKGANLNLLLKDHRGDLFKAAHASSLGKFKWLLDAGSDLSGETECQTFKRARAFYNDRFLEHRKEEIRVIFRDDVMKKFKLSKQNFFDCVDLNSGPVCALVPEICEKGYQEIMAE